MNLCNLYMIYPLQNRIISSIFCNRPNVYNVRPVHNILSNVNISSAQGNDTRYDFTEEMDHSNTLFYSYLLNSYHYLESDYVHPLSKYNLAMYILQILREENTIKSPRLFEGGLFNDWSEDDF